MKDKKSIINPELYHLTRKNGKIKYDTQFKYTKKPLLRRFLDKCGDFCKKITKKVKKRPVFFILFIIQTFFMGFFMYKLGMNEEITSFKLALSSFFSGFFGYFTFFSKK